MSERPSYQCAIIGGGLAGLALSIQLARAGLSVVLFEKEEYPFHKVCGEYIGMESWSFLETLGVPLTQMHLPRITQLHVSSPTGNRLAHKLDPGGFGVSRYQLDNCLARIAEGSGVKLMERHKVTDVTKEGTTFTIRTTGGVFTSGLVMGSWGKRSNMDVKLNRGFIEAGQRGLSNYVGVKYHVQADLPDHLIELHNFRNGYCGISKIEDGKYCLCYLVSGDELKRAGGSISALQENVLSKNPFLQKYFASFPVLYDKPLSISQISFERKSTAENGIMMLGDAAGLITPLCGNGMSMALRSSQILAGVVNDYYNNRFSFDAMLSCYESAWHKQFSQRLKTGRFIQKMFGNERLTGLLIGVLKPFPSLVTRMIASTHGVSF